MRMASERIAPDEADGEILAGNVDPVSGAMPDVQEVVRSSASELRSLLPARTDVPPPADELQALDLWRPEGADWRIREFAADAAHRRWVEKARVIGEVASSVAIALAGSGWVLVNVLS